MFPTNTTSGANYRTGSVQDQSSGNRFLSKIGGKLRRSSMLGNNADAPGGNTEIASLPEEFDIKATYALRVKHDNC